MLMHKVQSQFWHSIAISSALVCTLILMGFSLVWAEGEVLEVKTFVSQDGVHPGGKIDVAFQLDIIQFQLL